MNTDHRAILLALVCVFPVLTGCQLQLPAGNLMPGSQVPQIGVNQLPLPGPAVPQFGFPPPPALQQPPFPRQFPPQAQGLPPVIIIVLRGAPLLPQGGFPPPPPLAGPASDAPAAGTGLYDPGPSAVGPTRELTDAERVFPPAERPVPPPVTPRPIPGEFGRIPFAPPARPPALVPPPVPPTVISSAGGTCSPGGG